MAGHLFVLFELTLKFCLVIICKLNKSHFTTIKSESGVHLTKYFNHPLELTTNLEDLVAANLGGGERVLQNLDFESQL